ncbi:hypothetical protein DXG01_005374 [Tephrocybe rancida]|nr:hypothetical protein DXG01_005374 [Tephrocybe rancida]
MPSTIDPGLLGSAAVIPTSKKVSRAAMVSDIASLTGDVASLKERNKVLNEMLKTVTKDIAEGNDLMAKEMKRMKEEVAELQKVVDMLKSSKKGRIEESEPDSGGVLTMKQHMRWNLAQHTQTPTFSSDETWPLKPGTDIRLTRFRWDKPHTDKVNWNNLMTISKELKANGAQTSPAAADAIQFVSKEDRDGRIIQKFKDLAKEVRRVERTSKTSVPGSSNDGEGQDNVVDGLEGGGGKEESVEIKVTGRPSRQNGKLKMRIKKRELLPLDSPWRDPKYEAAMTTTLMSDDEDYYVDGKLVPGRYLARPPLYRTDILNEFYTAIDSVVPDDIGKYTLRVRGDPKDCKPPKAHMIKNKARRWMVSPDWLNLNDTNKACNKLLADNGKLWGDAKDLEELVELQKRARDEKSAIQRKKIKLEDIEAKGKGKGKAKVAPVEPADDEDFSQTDED